jgi:hypothetical protein
VTLAHGVAAGHGTHLLMTLGPMALIAVAATLADLRRRLDRPALPVAATIAVGLSMVAGIVHFAATPEHFEESALYGTFFVACGVAQLAWPALAVLRTGRWVLWAGAAGNLLVAGLWLWTRTAGIPLGPERGVVEPVAPVDLLAAVTEVGVAAACLCVLVGAARAVVPPLPARV